MLVTLKRLGLWELGNEVLVVEVPVVVVVVVVVLVVAVVVLVQDVLVSDAAPPRECDPEPPHFAFGGSYSLFLLLTSAGKGWQVEYSG